MSKKIKVSYITHYYNPKKEAVSQEIEILKNHFGGYIYDLKRYNRPILRKIKGKIDLVFLSKSFDLVHMYQPKLDPENQLFKFIRNKIIFSCVSPNLGYDNVSHLKKIHIPEKVKMIVTVDKENAELIAKEGIKNITYVLPGININKFSKAKNKSIQNCVEFLMGSAPWLESQFESKGINLLLEACHDFPRMRLTFFWRNALIKKMEEKISKMKLEKQIRILNFDVDVVKKLSDCHGAVAVFTKTPGSKGYPNSIIESLAAGKPVIVSNIMPIAKIVNKEQCGIVIKPNKDSLLEGIKQFMTNYPRLQKTTKITAEKYFNENRLINEYNRIYEEVKNN